MEKRTLLIIVAISVVLLLLVATYFYKAHSQLDPLRALIYPLDHNPHEGACYENYFWGGVLSSASKNYVFFAESVTSDSKRRNALLLYDLQKESLVRSSSLGFRYERQAEKWVLESPILDLEIKIPSTTQIGKSGYAKSRGANLASYGSNSLKIRAQLQDGERLTSEVGWFNHTWCDNKNFVKRRLFYRTQAQEDVFSYEWLDGGQVVCKDKQNSIRLFKSKKMSTEKDVLKIRPLGVEEDLNQVLFCKLPSSTLSLYLTEAEEYVLVQKFPTL